MRRALFLSSLVAVLAALIFVVIRTRESHEPHAPAAELAPDVVVPTTNEQVVLADQGLVDAEPRAIAGLGAGTSAAGSESTIPADPSRCVVIGRVLDVNGDPVVGAQVRLFAFRVWAADIDVPRLAGRFDFRGFEVATDAIGNFRIEAPPPTATRVTFEIRPGRYLDSHTIYFAESGRRMQQPLTAGVRDLGEIRLARTGALIGRVIDTEGRPIADAQVSIGETFTTTLERDTQSTADGTYVVAHAPSGTYGVTVHADRYISHFEPGITVEMGRDSLVPNIVLAIAPTIEGVVVDELDRPVAGARFSGWPVGTNGGRGARGTSGADGRFVIPLPQAAPHTLSAKLDGHLTWGDEQDESTVHAPGTRDLRVVMPTVARTQFKVLDGDTNEPVESFGLSILADNGSLSKSQVFTERRRPTPQPRPGGVGETTARVGVDLVLVAADGYELFARDVAHDVESIPTQTVRLQRGASVRGRVLHEGSALANALVEIVEIRSLGSNVEGALDRDRYYSDANTRRSTRTKDDGRFELAGLGVGDHRLTVHPAKGARRVLAPVLVRKARVTELGDVDVLPGATIVGEILMPSGSSPSGLVVLLDDRHDEVQVLADAAGRFRFEDVPPGVRYVMLAERAGEIASGEPLRVEVPSGETKSITIDARDRAMCSVELRVHFDGVPTENVHVYLASTKDPHVDEELGALDAAGWVKGSVRAFGRARVRVVLPGYRQVEHPSAELALVPQGRVSDELRFDFARLELRLPIAPPKDGSIRLSLVPGANDRNAIEEELAFAGGSAVGATPFLRADGDRLFIAGLLAGSYALTVEWVDAKAEPEPQQGSVQVWPPQRPAYHRATANVVLVASDVVVIEL